MRPSLKFYTSVLTLRILTGFLREVWQDASGWQLSNLIVHLFFCRITQPLEACKLGTLVFTSLPNQGLQPSTKRLLRLGRVGSFLARQAGQAHST